MDSSATPIANASQSTSALSPTHAAETSSTTSTLTMSDVVPHTAPPLDRTLSDPIPHTTTAMSSLTTSEGEENAMKSDGPSDGTSVKANARVASLLRQSLLGKRKDPEPKSSQTSSTETNTSASSSSSSSSLPQVDTDATMTGLPSVSESELPPSASPPIELPTKKTKFEDTPSNEVAVTSNNSHNSLHPDTAVPVPSASTTQSMRSSSSSSSESESESSSSSSPSPSPPTFDPFEVDHFGTLLSAQSFDTYFDNKWEHMNEPKDVSDPVQFGVDGWKERYYDVKLHFNFAESKSDPISSDARTAHTLFKTYLEGLCWVMHYYFRGPASWDWYFPFHYAPLAEDLAVFLLQEGGLRNGCEWTLGRPFTPMAQLMAVLPEKSNHCVPKSIRKLMTHDASVSPLASFYPTHFELDLNGKRFTWQSVALLPFIDSDLLLRELSKVEHTFTEEERQRNTLGYEYLFVHHRTPLGTQLVQQVYLPFASQHSDGLLALRRMTRDDVESAVRVVIHPTNADGLTGTLRPYARASVPGLQSVLSTSAEQVECVSGVYNLLEPPRAHVCQLLPKADPFTPSLTEDDYRTLVPPREFRPHRHHHHHHHHHHRHQKGSVRTRHPHPTKPDWLERRSHRADSAERRAYAMMAHLR